MATHIEKNLWSERKYAAGGRDVLIIVSPDQSLPNNSEAVPRRSARLTGEDQQKLKEQGLPSDCQNELDLIKGKLKLDEVVEGLKVMKGDSKNLLFRKDVIKDITQLLKCTKNDGVVLHYIGAGRRNTGDWCFEDGYISFRDIAELYLQAGFSGHVLTIASDCSYSGCWVKDCMEFLDEQGVQPCGHKAREKGLLFKIHASCLSHQIPTQYQYALKAMEFKDKHLFYRKDRKLHQETQKTDGCDFTEIYCHNKTSIDHKCTMQPGTTWVKQSINQSQEAPIDRAIKAANEVLDENDPDKTLGALKNPEIYLTSLDDGNAKRYQSALLQAKQKKLDNSQNENLERKASNDLMTQGEIQDEVNRVNASASQEEMSHNSSLPDLVASIHRVGIRSHSSGANIIPDDSGHDNEYDSMITDGLTDKESQEDGLQGVDVIAETNVLVSNGELDYTFPDDYGLKLHIPENSLPVSTNQCTINIKVSLGGQYLFPDDYQLVSAVFWLRCEPMCKFSKPITLEIEHCALLQNCSKLTFVRAVCTQKELPYIFNSCGGKFMKSYGNIDLKAFSGLAVVQYGEVDRSYYACLLYKHIPIRSSTCIVEIFFIVVWNTLAHQKFALEHFMKNGATPGPNQRVEFQSDVIELKIKIPEGLWKVIPLILPTEIEKKEVDTFCQDKRIPHCHFKAKHVGDIPNVPDLECEMEIIGTKKKRKFRIDFSPQHSEGFPPSQQREALNTDMRAQLPKLKDAYRTLLPVSKHWNNIGALLGVPAGTLEKITTDEVGVDSCLRVMLAEWLKQVDPIPTWAALFKAVEPFDATIAKSIL